MASYFYDGDTQDLESRPETERQRISRVLGMSRAISLYVDQPLIALFDSLVEAGNDPDNPFGTAPNAAAEASSAFISYHLSAALKLAILHTSARLGLGEDMEEIQKFFEQPASILGKALTAAMEEFQKEADKIAASRN